MVPLGPPIRTKGTRETCGSAQFILRLPEALKLCVLFSFVVEKPHNTSLGRNARTY